jgi:hypothetical protein
MTNEQNQGPKELWLQLHGDCTEAERDSPVDYTAGDVTWCWHSINDSDVRYVRADLAQPQEAQEPVAWISPEYFTAYSRQGFQVSTHKIAPSLVPLYASQPPAREPMTPEQRTELLAREDWRGESLHRLIEAVEQYHGIGSKTAALVLAQAMEPAGSGAGHSTARAGEPSTMPLPEPSLLEVFEQLRAAAPGPTVEANSQDWEGMDGVIAWHLIDRHGDNWADIGLMMNEWLAANTARAREASAWRPIETAPKDGTPVLAYGEPAGEISGPSGVMTIEVACYQPGGDYRGFDWSIAGDAYGNWFKPTHWMPLPDAPSRRSAAEAKKQDDPESSRGTEK